MLKQGHLYGRWFRIGLIPLMALSLAASVYYANKSYRTFMVLESARALDMPATSAIRGWMTLGYVAGTYDMTVQALVDRLELPPETLPDKTVRALAEDAGVDLLIYVQKVQRAIADISAAQRSKSVADAPAGWLQQLADDSLSALLVYGYPILGLVLFLGALGLPVPAGPLTAVAGTLALQGEINWLLACALATSASMLGDLTGYAAGRLLNPQFLDRWGHWIGYTRTNRQRLERLYANWGGLTLILTRSLVAYIGVIASLLAGAGRYSLNRFLVFSMIGRLLWTAAYFGLGYAVGTDFEAASGFLGYLSLFLITLAVTLGSGALYLRLRKVSLTS